LFAALLVTLLLLEMKKASVSISLTEAFNFSFVARRGIEPLFTE
jgi:hypothetical protein